MIGELLAVAAAVLFGVSISLQKYALKQSKKFEVERLLNDRAWLFSVAIGLSGIAFYMASLGLKPISSIQPILSISLIIPLLIGRIWFGEDFGKRKVHILIILAGVLLSLS